MNKTQPGKVSQSEMKVINRITAEVIAAACKVHTSLGAGLLEHTYKHCLKWELEARGRKVYSEVKLPVVYTQTQGVLLCPKLHVFGYERRFRQKTGQKHHIPKR